MATIRTALGSYVQSRDLVHVDVFTFFNFIMVEGYILKRYMYDNTSKLLDVHMLNN